MIRRLVAVGSCFGKNWGLSKVRGMTLGAQGGELEARGLGVGPQLS